MKKPNTNSEYYVSEEFPKVSHVIMAKDGTEAGKYYNNSARDILIRTIDDATSRNIFKLEDSLTEYLHKSFKSYIEEGFKYEIEEQKKDTSMLLRMIPTSEKKDFVFKNPTLDRFGFLKFSHPLSSNNMNLPCHIYENPSKKEYVIEIEVPGFSIDDFNKNNFKFGIKYDDNGFWFAFSAERRQKDHIEKTVLLERTFGVVDYRTVTITPVTKLVQFKSPETVPDLSFEDGVFKAIYKLKD